MIILGIDPGTVSIGYSILRAHKAKPDLLDAGLLRVTSSSVEARLHEVHDEMQRLITQWKPTCVSVEKLYFATNLKTAMAVSESRGVILLTASLAGLKVYEYTPLEIKKIVTGDGNADKKQIEKMIRLTLHTAKELKARDDVFDAIASSLACCYLESHRFHTHEA